MNCAKKIWTTWSLQLERNVLLMFWIRVNHLPTLDRECSSGNISQEWNQLRRKMALSDVVALVCPCSYPVGWGITPRHLSSCVEINLTNCWPFWPLVVHFACLILQQLCVCDFAQRASTYHYTLVARTVHETFGLSPKCSIRMKNIGIWLPDLFPS